MPIRNAKTQTWNTITRALCHSTCVLNSLLLQEWVQRDNQHSIIKIWEIHKTRKNTSEVYSIHQYHTIASWFLLWWHAFSLLRIRVTDCIATPELYLTVHLFICFHPTGYHRTLLMAFFPLCHYEIPLLQNPPVDHHVYELPYLNIVNPCFLKFSCIMLPYLLYMLRYNSQQKNPNVGSVYNQPSCHLDSSYLPCQLLPWPRVVLRNFNELSSLLDCLHTNMAMSFT